jgi:Mg-chelatase subunit ChlD
MASGGMGGGGMGGAEALQRRNVETGKALRYLAPGSESKNQAYPYKAAIVPAAPGGRPDRGTSEPANSPIVNSTDMNSRFNAGETENNLNSPVEAPASERLGWENGLWKLETPNTSGAVDMPKFNLQAPEPEFPSFHDGTVAIPDGGSVMLDGVKKLRDQILLEDAASSTLMMTETPRIIIPEVVEESSISLERNLNEVIVDKSKSLDALMEDEPVLELSLGQSASPSSSPSMESLAQLMAIRKDRLDSLPMKKERSKQPQAMDEQNAATDSFSTFSLHVSDVSFKLAQTALSQGQWPEAARIRIEEFVNALDYRDPLPTGNQQVACRVEQAIHPFLMQRNLLRVSMRTAATGRSQTTPLRLTLLLDNSGSMERPDRRQAVLNAFQTLTQQLSATDQVTLISFANTPRLLAEKVPGNQGETLLKLIENLPSEGGTNIEAALMLAREKATEQLLAGAQNRIVLFTDGAVNLGNANPDSLAKLIVPMRDAGIAFDAAGISAQDLNDDVLEALTRQGDGRYYLLDSAEAVDASFASQIAGALRPSAQNVKVQMEFNPSRVGRYKLLGFEKHRLNQEDFRNDKVDAAELAAAEAGVAVYQLEAKPNGSGDVGSVSVRFLDLETGRMVERRWPIPYEPNAPRFEQATPSMQLAASAALFASKLSGGPLAESVDVKQLQKVLSNLPEPFAGQTRVQQVRSMMDQANAMGE